MKNNYGQWYTDAHRGTRTVSRYWVVRKSKTGNYIVKEFYSGNIYGIYPTKLRAYYVASRLSGSVSGDVFVFGEGFYK